MKRFVPAADFAIRTWPPEARLVALISGYFDDSQSVGDLWGISGYVGYVNQWEYLERLWNKAMADHGVPYFHMREMNDPSGPFAKWLPPEDHEAEVIAFFTDLVGAIRKCGLRMFASAVWIKDLDRFNGEKGILLEPYPLAAFACMSQMAFHYNNVPVTAVFDRVEKVDDKLQKARAYGEWLRLCDLITSVPLAKGLTSRDVPAMQAADFIAWEFRKALFKMKPWQELSGRPLGDREAQWLHYMEWTRETTGRDPFLRKSLDALIAEMPTHAVVWDYHQISTTHDARGGIWTEVEA
jgi:hypothetical protein